MKTQGCVTYTVPKTIRVDNLEKNAELMFRVNQVCGASQIVVKSGDNTLAAFKRERLAPGEMERIVVPKMLLQKAENEITVCIEEVRP